MNRRVLSFFKYNKLFVFLYRLAGSILVSILKIFVPIKDKRILFVSYGGRKFDDSPKALYDSIKIDEFFKDYELIWAFDNPASFDTGCKKIKVDTLRYYIAALSSKIWISNSGIERGLNLKRKSTLEIDTWHGTPLKKIGLDVKTRIAYKKSKRKTKSIFCAQSEFDREIFSRLFNTDKENILLSDLPRNDSLVKYTDVEINNIKNNLGIAAQKKIILYAPTYREFDRDKLNGCYIAPPINWDKWEQELGKEYIVLFRAHYEIVKILGVENSEFVKDVSNYPCLNDLIAVSDLLVSDYSSIYFDYSITEKPMLCFAYDKDIYASQRGLYFDLEDIMPCNINLDEDSLIQEIKNLSYEEYCTKTKIFKDRFAPYAGNATLAVINTIKEKVGK